MEDESHAVPQYGNCTRMLHGKNCVSLQCRSSRVVSVTALLCVLEANACTGIHVTDGRTSHCHASGTASRLVADLLGADKGRLQGRTQKEYPKNINITQR